MKILREVHQSKVETDNESVIESATKFEKYHEGEQSNASQTKRNMLLCVFLTSRKERMQNCQVNIEDWTGILKKRTG